MFRVRVNNQDLPEYVTCTVIYGVESLARNFELTTRIDSGGIPFKRGDDVVIYLGNDIVLEGYVAIIDGTNLPGERGVTYTGYSYTMKLLKGSAVYKTGTWKNVPASRVFEDVCDTVGVGVKIDSELTALLSEPVTWKIDSGETCFDCLEKLAKYRAVFLTSDAGRNLIVTRASTVPLNRTVIETGGVALGCKYRDSIEDRFSHYVVKSQDRAPVLTSLDDTEIKRQATVDDDAMPFFLPHVVHVDSGQGSLSDRAEWEMRTRAGRSERIVYQVNRFVDDSGAPWPIAQNYQLRDELLRVDTVAMLINVRMESSESSVNVSLEFGNAEAFDVVKIRPRRKNRAGSILRWG